MIKAVFLDRDGTLNRDIGYVYRISDLEILPDVVETLRILIDKGYVPVIITNQSGIARGYYTEADYANFNEALTARLAEQGVEIRDSYFCPHLPDAPIERYRRQCDCRKPKTALFRQAAEDLDIDIDQSIAIGDKLRDCCICRESGCRGFVVTKDRIDISEFDGNVTTVDSIKDVLMYV